MNTQEPSLDQAPPQPDWRSGGAGSRWGLRFASKVRARETPFYDLVYRAGKRTRSMTLPNARLLGMLLLGERSLRRGVWRWLKNQYVSQIMNYRCTSVGHNVAWDGDVPLVYGAGEIHIGNAVHIGNNQTWIVGFKSAAKARLVIGDHTHINYRTTISVAKSVTIGSYCLLAGEIKIFDNNSHPLNHLQRRGSHVLSDQEIAPVVIEDDVWIGTNCVILKGVRIGRGAVVAAGSIVTKDVAPFTLVGGNPARLLKTIEQ